MKTTGIVLMVLGGLAIIGSISGGRFNPTGIALIIIGLFLLSRVSKKKEKEENKKQWEQENIDNKKD